MRHLDLFSGIGGFAYAADQVWDNVEHVFCDNDLFCQQVLKKHWPEAPIFNDIKDITDPDFTGLQRQDSRRETRRSRTGKRVDLLTGGFPCQPFSAAGLRRGTADDRHLWPEMLRVIRLTKPQWLIAENVRGLLTWNEGLVFEQVCLDLEAEGYEVQPLIIPAVAVNAPHRRDRIWFVATNTESRQRRGRVGLQRQQNKKDSELGGTSQRPKWWNEDWQEVAAELCGVDDGLPAELDGFKLTKPQHRTERLKSLGNAIVPEVAIEIMKGIMEVNV